MTGRPRLRSPWTAVRGVTAALALLFGAGCAVHPGTAVPADWAELRNEPGWTALAELPMVEQSADDDCGAAALSMVLARWGVDAPATELRSELAVEGVPGIRAADLRDAARRRGLSAYLVAGDVQDLERELGLGRPVLVGLVKSWASLRLAHYEVVVGLRRPVSVAALDPSRGLVRDSLPAFAAEWAAAQGAMLVVFRPESNPHIADGVGP